MSKCSVCVLVAVVCGLAASGQSVDGKLEEKTKLAVKNKLQEDLAKTVGSVQFTLGLSGPVVRNQPFSGDGSVETVQNLANGTHIRQTRRYSIYRDSEGRVRRETKDATGAVQEVMITDPVSGVSYWLDLGTLTARQMPIGIAKREKDENRIVVAIGDQDSAEDAHQKAKPLHESGGDHPDTVRQSLGTQIIEGVSAEGTKVTRIIPAGSIGNDQPIVVVSESWYSPELQTVVMSLRNDPRTAEALFKLRNIRRAEPDPSLFQVPAKFRIVAAK